MNVPQKITLVGAGNVAWHLGHRLVELGYEIVKIISRKSKRAEKLAVGLQSRIENDFNVSNAESDFVIVAINDTFLCEVLHKLDSENSILLHTSGSIGMDAFPKYIYNYGVLYPFQTLTAGVDVSFEEIPLCIEGSGEKTLDQIAVLAKKMGPVVRIIDSEQRRILHLAGVIGNNFTNHLMALAYDMLEKNNIDKKLLTPLLDETLHKLKKTSAYEAQTGPARRNNKEVIEKHIKLLDDEPSLKKLYSIISDSIIAYYSR